MNIKPHIVWSRIDPIELRKDLDSNMINILDALIGRSIDDIPLKDDKIALDHVNSYAIFAIERIKKYICDWRKKNFELYLEKYGQ